MIIYNKTWLANGRLQTEVKKDLQQGRITEAEFKLIAEKYPVGFYTPNLLIRVGLFILTCIIVLFTDGLLSLMASGVGIFKSGWFFFLGLLSYISLEFIVSAKYHYRSGVDDALLFITGCLLVTGFTIMFMGINNGTDYFLLYGIVFLLTLYFSIRFGDMLMSAACCISLFASIFTCWIKVTSVGLTTIPFIMMLVSVAIYWLSYTYTNRTKLINYQNCLIIGQIVCLVTLYAAGNYYIVQTLSDELNGQSKTISFGAFFWVWTILLPFIYLGFGIRKKDVILLRTGLLLIAIAAATFRNYYHILPIDITLTLLGVIILGIVYGVMRYLKTPKQGFTYAMPDETHLADHIKIESLVIAETFSHSPSPPADEGVKFGGGDFGGGGSSGTF